jgi:hypothetical protein
MKRRSVPELVLVVSLCLPVAAAVLSTASASAEQTTFTQKILPANCMFETVNDGTGTLRYLTPATCWQFVPQFFMFPPAAKPSDQAQTNAFGQRPANEPVLQPGSSFNSGDSSEHQSNSLLPFRENNSVDQSKQTEASGSQAIEQSWLKRHKKLVTVAATTGSLLLILLFVYIVIL